MFMYISVKHRKMYTSYRVFYVQMFFLFINVSSRGTVLTLMINKENILL